MRKIKVVWICHLSSEEIRSHLHLYINYIEKWTRKLLGIKTSDYSDIAIWNVMGIKKFEKNGKIELHIVSPHKGMKKCTEEFSINGVYYHFFQSDLPFPLNEIEKRFNSKQYSEFPRNRKRIKVFLNKIKPDIINLIGAECPYFSISALDIEDVPLYVSCQTIYSNPERKLRDPHNTQSLNWEIEQKVFKNTKYFGCSGIMHYELVKYYVPNAFVFPIQFLSKPMPVIKDVPKTFDFAYWGRNSKSKGIENAIEALAIIKRKYPEVSLLIAGGGKPEYVQYIKKKIVYLDLADNIKYIGRVSQLENMLTTVKRARFAILPIKLDIVSGTIIEAMKMGMPVVTHRTSGTPMLNKHRQTVLLSEIDDIPALAKNMMNLMESSKLAESLKNNAYQYLEEQLKDDNYADNYIRQYRAIIAHYHNGTPIPEELLFNPENYTA